jgi:hypothetical protein
MGRDLGLHDIPVFDEAAVVDAKDVHSYHRLGCPAYVTPVDHDDVAFCHDHSWLVSKSFRKRAHKSANGITSTGDGWIVLDVVRRE